MTFDAILFSSLYMIAFVAALRRVPLFPRFLLHLGLRSCDAARHGEPGPHAGHVPPAVADALTTMLTGNVKKTLISVALWELS